MSLEHILRQIESDRDNLRHDRSPLWIIADPPWHTDAVGGAHHQRLLKVKYLNNIIERGHRFIKKTTRPMLGFKSFVAAQATLAGIEIARMIRKGQLAANGQNTFQQFAALAG